MEQAIMGGERPDIPDHTPDQWAALMRSCWAADPEERPSFADVVFTYATYWTFSLISLVSLISL